MKKVISTAVAVFLFAFANAQEVKCGIKVGGNLSNFSGYTDDVNLKPRIGLTIGGFVAVKLSEKLSVQPEILYSEQGSKVDNFLIDVDGSLYNVDLNFNLAYINLPVMFKYYATEKFSIEAGPQIGFLTSAKGILKLEGFNHSAEEDMKMLFKSIDFGLDMGLTYDLAENISVGARYNLGVANIAKTVNGDTTKLHNSIFSLSAAYQL